LRKSISTQKEETDLWQSLLTTFNLFEHSDQGAKLGISTGSGYLHLMLWVVYKTIGQQRNFIKKCWVLVTLKTKTGN
jgi:hypothetical protein